MEGNPIIADAADAAKEGAAKIKGRFFPVNTSMGERWASAALGGVLIAFGMRSRTWMRWPLAVAGGDLLARGASGRSLLYRILDIDRSGGGLQSIQKAVTGRRFTVEKTITIAVPAGEAFRFWRNFENLPRVMRHLKSVRTMDEKRSHWTAKAPVGLGIEWDAEITDERQDRKIAWSTVADSEIETKGVVMFEPVQDGNATEVRVYLEYLPPAGKIGKTFAKLFGKDPSRTVEEDLRSLKSTLETGAAVLDRTPRG